MSEGPDKCDTALRRRIIELLDPIINSGIPSNETPIPTPTPVTKPIENVNIDQCINNAIEKLTNAFNSSYSDITPNKLLSFWDNPSNLESWFDDIILGVAKDYTETNSVVNFINESISSFTDSKTIFKRGRTNNLKSLIIPTFMDTPNFKTFPEFQYTVDWDAADSFIELSNIKIILFMQFFNCYTIRDLITLKNKTNVNKQIEAQLIANRFQDFIDQIYSKFGSISNWGDNNYLEQTQGRKIDWSNKLITDPNIIPKSLDYMKVYTNLLGTKTKLQNCINN